MAVMQLENLVPQVGSVVCDALNGREPNGSNPAKATPHVSFPRHLGAKPGMPGDVQRDASCAGGAGRSHGFVGVLVSSAVARTTAGTILSGWSRREISVLQTGAFLYAPRQSKPGEPGYQAYGFQRINRAEPCRMATADLT
jgi:hypothetical protein